MESKMIPTENIARFVFGGRAYFVLRNPVSGREFRFRVNRGKDRRTGKPTECLFAADITDALDGDRGTYLGYISDSDQTTLRPGQKGRPEAEAFKALAWLLRHLDAPAPAQVCHDGRCARCGRRLDDPISIATGFGPDCSKILDISRQAPEEPQVEYCEENFPVISAQAIARAKHGDLQVFPFRTPAQAQAYVHAQTDEGLLTVDEAVEMYEQERMDRVA